eukprot:TRINITY_DN121143_c0_g1_i1.p1 TRINITY_DN121143_c0_g1~~TRINITY_DN121143_c0_g1_i1.p1  ORF type:complete len:979 (+),score=364.24 TRINITY_DN121143_c0_g1_i1:125-3061(+)
MADPAGSMLLLHDSSVFSKLALIEDSSPSSRLLRRRLASEAGEKESIFAGLRRARKAVDHHCRQLSDLASRAPDADAAESEVSAFVGRVQSAAKAFDAELQEALAADKHGGPGGHAAPGDSTLDTGAQPGSPGRSYGVLRHSLEETQRRFEDLNNDMARQVEANEELVSTLNTAKDSNRRLLEQIQSQTAEITRLTQRRVADEERLQGLRVAGQGEEAKFAEESRRRLQAAREAGQARVHAMEKRLGEQLKHLRSRLEELKDELAALKTQCGSVQSSHPLGDFRKHLQHVESVVLEKVASDVARRARKRSEVEAVAAELQLLLQREADGRQKEALERGQRQAVLGVEREQLQAKATRELGQLTSQSHALDRLLRAERKATAEEKTRWQHLRERLLADREDAETAHNELKRDAAHIESAANAFTSEARMKEQSIAELRRQARESDDALAAATSGNEHLLEQLEEQKRRTSDAPDSELSVLRGEHEQQVALIKTAHEAEMEAAASQIDAMEAALKRQREEAADLQAHIDGLRETSQASRTEIQALRSGYEAACMGRQQLEAEMAEARKEFLAEQLHFQALSERTSRDVASMESEVRVVADRFVESKRLTLSRENELTSRIGALEDLARETQAQLMDTRQRLGETDAAIERLHLEAGEAQRRAATAEAELEEELRRKRGDLAQEKQRLEEQVASERHSAISTVKEAERRRESQAASLRQLQDECNAKLVLLERERARAEDQHLADLAHIQKDGVAQQSGVEQLDRDLTHVRLLLAESQSNLSWVRQERQRQEKEAQATKDRLGDELKHASDALVSAINEEAKAKAKVNAAAARQTEQSRRLSRELLEAKQRGEALESNWADKSKQLQTEFEVQVREAEDKMREGIAANRVRLDALERENEQLRAYLREQGFAAPGQSAAAHSAHLHSAALLPAATEPVAAYPGARSSFGGGSLPLESHLERLRRHTEELRSDLARRSAGGA